MIELVPAILETDPEVARERVRVAQSVGASLLHVDISDGDYTPTITAQLGELAAVLTTTPVEVHLMVQHPEHYLSECASLNVQRILVHRNVFESTMACISFLEQARRYVDDVGLVLDLDGDIQSIGDLPVSTVQCMGVVPGKAGQEMDSRVVSQVRNLLARFPTLVVAVDGGVGGGTIQELVLAGAKRLVINSSLYRAVDPVTQYHYLMSLTRGI